ncbi:protein SSUH2 homolog isoform X1 [Xenopus tropicalis]|uniref:Protein SSUH2 homolog isoform X1 n=2 Tax=Xenopus tropicalis TaxID=8364 RepID=F6S850_XENTR|nr:protein SSUH2 homolog isoform X1 [Xenopus tropicalis]
MLERMEEHKLLRNMEGNYYGSVAQPHLMGQPSQPMMNAYPGVNTMYGPPPSQSMGAAPFVAPVSPYPNLNSSLAAPTYPPVGMDSPSAPLLGPGAIGPTAPSSDMFGPVPGYEGIGDNSGRFLPPPPPALIPGPAVPSPENAEWTIPCISEDAAKEAFLQYAKESCCYGTSPAQDMVFKEFTSFNTYRYRLETFTESREFNWQTKPFDGHAADVGVHGTPPQPWDIPVQYPALFKDDEKKMPVPGTSSIKTCPQCMGIGKTTCTKCAGTGRVQCTWCHGTGHRDGEDSCSTCQGHGTESCRTCSGAMQCCQGCSGKGKVVNFIQLTVTWKNNIFEFVADHNSDFQTDLFKKVTGEKLFTDEQHLVSPLVTFPKQSINKASQDGQNEHYNTFSSTSRILRQRQTIELLPLTKVHYTWKENPYSYFVYGRENKVYTTNYPQKCCCVLL